MPSCFRSCLNASFHFFSGLCPYSFLPRAEAALLTILPDLLLTKVFFVRPPRVFSFLPLKTAALARLPCAITLTLLTVFMAFMAFMGFMAFMAAFMAFMAFIAVFAVAFIAVPF